jgi:hypothetical protein
MAITRDNFGTFSKTGTLRSGSRYAGKMLVDVTKQMAKRGGTGSRKGYRFRRIKQSWRSRAFVWFAFCQRVAKGVHLCRALATGEAKPLIRPAGPHFPLLLFKGISCAGYSLRPRR